MYVYTYIVCCLYIHCTGEFYVIKIKRYTIETDIKNLFLMLYFNKTVEFKELFVYTYYQ